MVQQKLHHQHHDMTEKFCVTMDSKEELELLVHMPNKIVKFKQLFNELYARSKNDEKRFILTKKNYQLMNILEEKLSCLSLKQQKQTNKDQGLYEVTRTPTVDDLKAIIQMYLINNIVVTKNTM